MFILDSDDSTKSTLRSKNLIVHLINYARLIGYIA